MIGQHWQLERLKVSDDFVRIEIAAALAREIPVVPVLVRGALLPAAEDLPDDVRDLVYRQAGRLSDVSFHRDAEALAVRIERSISHVVRRSAELVAPRRVDDLLISAVTDGAIKSWWLDGRPGPLDQPAAHEGWIRALAVVEFREGGIT